MSAEHCIVSVVTGADAFFALREEWNTLLQRSVAKSICLTWEWLHTWWQTYGSHELQLHLVLVHVGGQLRGIAPFCLQRSRRLGVPVRSLRFLGTGETETDAVVSEYLDIIAAPADVDRVAEAIANHLAARQRSWDRILLNDVLQAAPVLTALRRCLAARRFSSISVDIGVRYAAKLPRTWSDYVAGLKPGAAKRLPYKRRKLERAGRLDERLIVAASELDAAFATLAELHTTRWNARGEPGVFVSRRFTGFHRRLAEQLLPLGMLRFRLWTLDGQPVAALYNFRCDGVEYYYQGGIALTHASRLSPGTVAHVYAIDGAIRDGIACYDFMRGGLDSYKTEFGCDETAMVDWQIFGKTLTGQALRLVNRLRRTIGLSPAVALG